MPLAPFCSGRSSSSAGPRCAVCAGPPRPGAVGVHVVVPGAGAVASVASAGAEEVGPFGGGAGRGSAGGAGRLSGLGGARPRVRVRRSSRRWGGLSDRCGGQEWRDTLKELVEVRLWRAFALDVK